jgi:hypothetical protein
MDEDLQRLFTAVEAAETEWREHRQSGWVAYYQGGTSVGTATGNPFTREWREREETLRAAFEAARQAWISRLPESG